MTSPLVPYQPDASADAQQAAAPAARVLRERLVETFERHVRIDSASDRLASCRPTTAMQRTFAEVLADDLRGLGCVDVMVDTYANVAGRLPGTTAGPPLLFSA